MGWGGKEERGEGKEGGGGIGYLGGLECEEGLDMRC